jgi:hypothetical protein
MYCTPGWVSSVFSIMTFAIFGYLSMIFEVLRTVDIKIRVFLGCDSCILLYRYQCFGGICYCHLFYTEDGGSMFL